MSASVIAKSSRPLSRAVFVEGARIPFMMSGTAYKDMIAQDLGRLAMKGLLTRTCIDPAALEYISFGTVIQEVRTSNLARECALGAGIPNTVPAHTVSMACISANAAVSSVASLINSGSIQVGLAGGAETMSDVPIRYSRPLRLRLMKAAKAKGVGDILALLPGLKLADLTPEAPSISEFSTGEVMGHSSDRLAATWGVTRSEQDDFAHASHVKAAAAHAAGQLTLEVVPVGDVTLDNGIKGDAPRSKYTSLKPAFIKPHGSHTAANSSFLTDGASAALIASEEGANRLGLKPKARLSDWIFTAQDPKDELLLGPAYAITRLMARNGLKASDVAVWEIHEAFAGQVLANLKALDSDAFVRDKVGLSTPKVGPVPMEALNAWGGSLSIGHPFGATGTRLVTTAANRLIATGGRFAILAACAAGGLGHAMLLEAYKQ